MIRKECPEIRDWEVGKIDKEFTARTRQSVCFNPSLETVRMKFFQRLPNKEEFIKIWKQKFSEWLENNKLSKNPSEEEINACIAMDYIFFRAILQHIFKINSSEELEKRIKEFPPHVVDDFLEKQFNKPSTKVDKKKEMVLNYLKKSQVDILCLQEAGCIDWKKIHIPGYESHLNHDSVIIYRKDKLGEIKHGLTEEFAAHLDFNKDSVSLFTDKNFLIISSHLKGKKEVNVQQSKEMFEVLKHINSGKPELDNLKVIVGMDANNFLNKDILFKGESKVFHMAPDHKDTPTTIKKRSFMQAQLKKAGDAVSEVKDHICSTLPIVASRIERIDGEESKNELLPNDVHPYDHYIVNATLLVE